MPLTEKTAPRSLTGKAIRTLRDSLHLTQHQLARRLGVHVVTVARWEGEACIPSSSSARLLALARASPVRFLKMTARFA